MIWSTLAELVLPTGKIRRAFQFVAMSRCWREHLRYGLSGYEVLA